MAKSNYLDLLLGKNIAPIQKEISGNVDKLKAAQQSLKNISEGAAALRNQATISYGVTAHPKTWKNIGVKPIANAAIKAKEMTQTGTVNKTIGAINQAQEAAKLNLRNEGLKTLGARAGTVAGLAAATAGGIYLKKKLDEKKRQDEAREAYYESLYKTASILDSDFRLAIMAHEILEGRFI